MDWLYLAVGAVCGASLRHGVFLALAGGAYPWATLAVNVSGCAAAGAIVEVLAARGALAGSARVFLISGFLGSYTTFSALALDALGLAERGGGWKPIASAALYAALSVAAGIASCAGAAWLARRCGA
ncbi:putative fluoride ion transporter CrcB [Alphaproteobacteria bacterium]|nr:putative fluoride ion transporter CrcB [Alphaproteobacteria bacterium]